MMGQQLDPMKILLVEDEEVNRLVATRILNKLGHSVDVAQNGKEAVRVAAVQHYDLVLMDLQMPEMDGLSATREIRRVMKDAEKPVIIAVTSLGKDDTREECLRAGMNDYMQKPVSEDSLRRMLSKWNSALNPHDVKTIDGKERKDPDLEARLELLKKETDAGFLKELIDLYLHSVKDVEQEITTSNRDRDARKLHIAAHTLKGSSANIGAVGVASACREIEELADSGRTDESGELISALRRELEIACTELREYRRKLDQ